MLVLVTTKRIVILSPKIKVLFFRLSGEMLNELLTYRESVTVMRTSLAEMTKIIKNKFS